jgi:hypothetical protein
LENFIYGVCFLKLGVVFGIRINIWSFWIFGGYLLLLADCFAAVKYLPIVGKHRGI